MTGPAEQFDYFNAFLGAAVGSIGLLLLSDRLGASPVVRVGAGLVPLIWYHQGFLRARRARGLDQNAVDSVYYLGFLVTLASLALGAWRMDGHDTKTLLAQFALGLVATGYALVARIHLQPAELGAGEQDAAGMATSAAESWQRIAAAAEVTLGRLAEAQLELHKGSASQMHDVRVELTRAMSEVVGEFRESMKVAVREAAAEVRAARVSAISEELSQERSALVAAVRESAEAVKETTAAYNGLSRRLGPASAAIEEAGNAVRELASRGAEGATAHLALARALGDAHQSAAGLKSGIDGLTEVVSREAATLQDVQLAGTDRLIAQLQEREERLLAVVAEFNAKLERVIGEVAEAGKATGIAMSHAAQELSDATKAAGASARVFSDGLVTAANSIVERTRGRASAS